MESAKTDPSQCENSGCLPTQLEHDGFIFHVQVEALHATRTTLNDLSYQGLVFVLIMIGLATGTLTGLTGASGMSILISALLLAGIEIREVIGLTFVITLVNAGIALSSYWRHDRVDVRCRLFVALPAMGAVLLGHFFSGAVEARWLTTVMIACLLIIGFKFLIFQVLFVS